MLGQVAHRAVQLRLRRHWNRVKIWFHRGLRAVPLLRPRRGSQDATMLLCPLFDSPGESILSLVMSFLMSFALDLIPEVE